MRFARAALSIVVLVATVSGASAETRPHKLKLPQSFSTIVKAQEKPLFTVAQPLVLAPVKTNSVGSLAETVGTVHQGFYPISEASSEGFNITGMSRQLPDLTRSYANNTAGLMSWTTKFN